MYDDNMFKMMLLIDRLSEDGHDDAYIDRVIEGIIRKDYEKQGLSYDDAVALAKNPSLADDPAFMERISKSYNGHKNQT